MNPLPALAETLFIIFFIILNTTKLIFLTIH